MIPGCAWYVVTETAAMMIKFQWSQQSQRKHCLRFSEALIYRRCPTVSLWPQHHRFFSVGPWERLHLTNLKFLTCKGRTMTTLATWGWPECLQEIWVKHIFSIRSREQSNCSLSVSSDVDDDDDEGDEEEEEGNDEEEKEVSSTFIFLVKITVRGNNCLVLKWDNTRTSSKSKLYRNQAFRFISL